MVRDLGIQSNLGFLHYQVPLYLLMYNWRLFEIANVMHLLDKVLKFVVSLVIALVFIDCIGHYHDYKEFLRLRLLVGTRIDYVSCYVSCSCLRTLSVRIDNFV